MTIKPVVFIAAILASGLNTLAGSEFQPGQVWLDTEGQPIRASSAGILRRGDVCYLYGADMGSSRRSSVMCYSSKDLYNWKPEGATFDATRLPPEMERGFVERPKVIFNEKTGKYVMWMHLDQRGYHYSRAGVAVSDKPTGPFTFLKAIRPITEDTGFKADDPDHQKELGGTFRDMNLFVDDDGKAYMFYASEGNWTMYVVRLDAEYTGPEAPAVQGKTWARVLTGKMREAPAPFKHNGKYHLITSGCTGWAPNPADWATASNLLGPWEMHGNPCVGPEAQTTFGAQSTFVLPVTGRPGCFIFMADRWVPRRLAESTQVWLPLRIGSDGTVKVEWRDRWDLSVFAN